MDDLPGQVRQRRPPRRVPIPRGPRASARSWRARSSHPAVSAPRARRSGTAARAASALVCETAPPLVVGSAASASRDGVEHEAAVVGGEGQRAQLVERPAQRHRAVPADAAIGRPETRRRRNCRAGERMDPHVSEPMANGHEPRRDGRARAAGRAAAPGVAIPRVEAGPGERGDRAGDSPCRPPARPWRAWRTSTAPAASSSLDDGGVVVETLLAERRRAPGGRDAAAVASRSLAPYGMPCSGPR